MLTGRKPHEGDIADPGRLQARARGRPAALARASAASRRTSTRWSPAPPPATATCARPTRGCCCTRCAGSAHALDHGVVDDPDLTADLTPTTPARRAPTPTTSTTSARITGRTILDARRRPADGGRTDDTSVLGARAVRRAAAGPRPVAAARPRPGSPHAPAAGRSCWSSCCCSPSLAGVGGWCFGVARYTTTPGVHQPDRGRRPRPRSRRPGWSFRGRRPGLLRDRRARARWSAPTRPAATACSRTAPSARSSRTAPSATRCPPLRGTDARRRPGRRSTRPS